MASARKKKSRKTYRVHAKVTNLDLAKAKSALRLEISCRGEKIGELEIGRGSLFWWGSHRKIGKRIPWSRFAELMNKLAYPPRDRGNA